MTKVDSSKYIVIQGWMVEELKLKGNELLIYAIIYGFSQDGESCFEGSLQYLANWTNSTKQGVIKNLKKLIEKGLIKKEEVMKNNIKYCKYRGIKQSLTVLNKVEWGIKQSLMGGIKQSLPNNIDINNINNNKKENIIKEKYGELKNVLLTKEEYNKLEEQFDDYKDKINNLSYYIGSTGKTYKSHYLTILNWSRKEKTPNKKSAYEKRQEMYKRLEEELK